MPGGVHQGKAIVAAVLAAGFLLGGLSSYAMMDGLMRDVAQQEVRPVRERIEGLEQQVRSIKGDTTYLRSRFDTLIDRRLDAR